MHASSKQAKEANAIDLWRRGDRGGAAAIMTALAEEYPDDPVLWTRLASLHSNTGDVQQSVDCFNRALEIDPDSESAHLGIAMVYGLSGAEEQARTHFSTVLELNPDNIEANVKLAVLEFYRSDIDTALRLLRKAESIDPDHLETNVRLAEVYAVAGDNLKAIAYLENADRIYPNNPEVLLRLASRKLDIAEYDEAYELIGPLVECAAPFIGAAVLLSDFCHHVGRCDTAQQALSKLLIPNIMGDDEMSICFALGKLLDRNKEYAQAFEYYRRANDLYSRRFDQASEQAWLNGICTGMGRSFISNAPVARTRPGRQPVFIVGMPRSGTSLVEQILASHPRVHGAGERVELNTASIEINHLLGLGSPYATAIADDPAAELDRLAAEYIKAVSEGAPESAEFITDKMPHNYRRLGYVQLLFPEARVIHCRRNALDTCLSNYFTLFRGAHEYSYRLDSLADKYVAYVRTMQHWKASLELDIIDVHYELLVTDPETEIGRILEFCGLEWSDSCLNFHATGRNVTTASRSQVRQPIYTRSVERWKNYQDQLGELRQLLEQRLGPDYLL